MVECSIWSSECTNCLTVCRKLELSARLFYAVILLHSFLIVDSCVFFYCFPSTVAQRWQLFTILLLMFFSLNLLFSFCTTIFLQFWFLGNFYFIFCWQNVWMKTIKCVSKGMPLVSWFPIFVFVSKNRCKSSKSKALWTSALLATINFTVGTWKRFGN